LVIIIKVNEDVVLVMERTYHQDLKQQKRSDSPTKDSNNERKKMTVRISLKQSNKTKMKIY
jgi:hypothetical protein